MDSKVQRSNKEQEANSQDNDNQFNGIKIKHQIAMSERLKQAVICPQISLVNIG